MKYMILIYGEEGGWASMAPAEQAEAMEKYFAYSDALAKAGKAVSGHELAPTTTAKTVKVRDGAPFVTDGPFADIKEQLGGYYLIEADDEADAVAWAAKCPGAHHGTVEVRPVLEH